MNAKKIILLVVVIANFCVVVAGFAKDPTFTTLEGKTVKYTELISAPKTILFVWTTLCPYCRQELLRLSEESVFLDDVDIYFVNSGERESAVKRFVDSKNLKSQIRKKVILDTEDFIANQFYIIAVPAYIFLKDKKPVYRSFYLDEKLLRHVFKE